MKKLMMLFCLAMIAGVMSCNKSFLDVKPRSFLSAGNYFEGTDHFIQAINGVYSPLNGLYTGSLWALAEMRSDNTSYQYNTGDRSGFPQERLDAFTEADDNPYVYSFFSTSYAGISRANVLLDHLQNSTLGDSLKNRITGEAKFLRAFYYFNLVRLMGDVPLVLHEVTSTSEAFSTAALKKPEEIYPVIIADLKDASNLLPVKYTQSEDIGRATKGAAETILAKVYMTQKDYADAIPLLENVRTLGYQLLPDYASIFNPNNKNNAESIFEVQYKEGSPGNPSNFAYTFVPYNSGSLFTGFPLNGNSTAQGWNIPTQDMVNAYEPGDKRKDASISLAFTDPNTGMVVPYILKYDHPPYQFRYQTSDDFIVTRYADVLLMLAECLNEKAFVPDGEAFQLLNEVRARAGLPPKTASNGNPSLQVASQDEFRKAVWHEERVELAFEDHRWFNLLRQGRAVAVMTAHGAEEKSLNSYGKQLPADAYQNIRLTYQYPRREAQLTH